MTDRLWFFSSFRNWGVNQNVANAFTIWIPPSDLSA